MVEKKIAYELVGIHTERMLALVIVFFVSASIIVLPAGVTSLSREEAIEASRNTTIVQTALDESSGTPTVRAHHWSVAHILSLDGVYPGDVYEKLPRDRGVWRVHWDITPPGYQLLHFIDELTGEILYENWYIAG